jgi:hypothetical protein
MLDRYYSHWDKREVSLLPWRCDLGFGVNQVKENQGS